MSEAMLIESGELILIMEINGRLVAVKATDVASVSEVDRCVPVPGGPAYIEGLGAQRSRALTVINASRAIGIEEEAAAGADHGGSDENDERCLIVIRDEYYYAIRPDRVIDVSPVDSGAGPVPKGLGDAWERVATGLVETAHGPALLIDLDIVLQGPAELITENAAAA